MKIFEALTRATQLLRENASPTPKADAELLLKSTLGSDRSYLISHSRDDLDSQQVSIFFSRIWERSQGKPVQYIIGWQEFRGLEFKVTPDVLIPRPESELLVEETLESVQTAEAVLVDVGTGSGCIAISLAVELDRARIFAIDVSAPALEVARTNATRHQVLKRIQFLNGDLLSPLEPLSLYGEIECIVANPPYVSERDFPNLQREVRDWEPRVALVASQDGLSIYERLVPQASFFLRPGGHLITEIGFNMEESVSGLFGPEWEIAKIRADLNGIPRVIVARKA
jgi:release factor glutamine methyltransferase